MRIIYLLVCVFSLTILFEGITESAIPFQAETPTETPTATPARPTPMNTPTPLPVPYTVEHEQFRVSQIARYSSLDFGDFLEIHPLTGDIAIITQYASDHTNRKYPTNFYNLYYVSPNSETPIERPFSDTNSSLYLNFSVENGLFVKDFSIGENNVVYTLNVRMGEAGGNITAMMPGNTTRTWSPFPYGRAVYVVKSTDNIPDTKPGDVLVLNWEQVPFVGLSNVIYKIDPTQEGNNVEVYLGAEELPQGVPIADINTGIGNQLFLVTLNQLHQYGEKHSARLLYVNDEKIVREWFHQDMNIPTNRLEFFAPIPSFFVIGDSQLHWTHENKTTLSVLKDMSPWSGSMVASLQQDAIYFTADDTVLSPVYHKGIYKLERKSLPIVEPTATPSAPTPSPTPIPGWLVLDGFGGIHQSNPSIPRPVLPYLPWNIIRDIEPDPNGRGWYMLDGFGGVHTSNPSMLKPVDLPYFGFDIARNLEVKQDVRGGYHFYLLDGYGGVHTNNPVFDYGSLPFFGFDAARDFEPVRDNAWMTMDIFGNTYENFGYFRDKITYAHPSSYYPIMRGMVRFPDDTKVMIDHFAGLHTNPFHPAWDKAAGLPDGFYFPGYDIIWDIEVIPQNLTGN